MLLASKQTERSQPQCLLRPPGAPKSWPFQIFAASISFSPCRLSGLHSQLPVAFTVSSSFSKSVHGCHALFSFPSYFRDFLPFSLTITGEIFLDRVELDL